MIQPSAMIRETPIHNIVTPHHEGGGLRGLFAARWGGAFDTIVFSSKIYVCGHRDK